MHLDPSVLFLLQPGESGAAAGGIAGSLIGLVFAVIAVAAYWRMFTKAGVPGWRCLVPVWNVITILSIVGKPWWWIFLMLVPLLNVIILVIVALDLGKSFGKSTLFSVLLLILFPIGWLIIGFDRSEYVGPGGERPSLA
jgi:hypothetical protein